MNTIPHSSQDQKTLPSGLSPAAEQRSREVATHLEAIEATVQRARDIACLFTYLSQESLNSSAKHIELDRQALRGVMERVCGDLDEALQSLDTAQDLFSLLTKKSDL